MSENRIPCNWEKCCTCAYWAGDRRAEFYGTQVVLDTNQFAHCMNRDYVYLANMPPFGSCSHFEKWPVLKD